MYDLVMATSSTTLDFEFLQRILPIEDLREFGYKNTRSTIGGIRSTLLSLENSPIGLAYNVL